MQQAGTRPSSEAEIGATIVAAMRQLLISPTPKNYELFYEAYTGGNSQLGSALLSLGERPTQDQLDTLADRFMETGTSVLGIERARDLLAREAEDIMATLNREKISLEKYGRILDRTSEGLKSTQILTQDILHKIVGIMSSATATKIDQGDQALTAMVDKAAELERVKTTLEEYKRLAETDSLTQLWNRRAFDAALADLFASRHQADGAALLLLDIDRFKDVNDRFGHPIGDQILQIAAGILRAHAGQMAMVSRTGGEEFALLVDRAEAEAIRSFAEQIRRSIEETPFVNKATAASYGRITISIGVCMGDQAESPSDLYAKADRALYVSKVNGRNRVSVYGSDQPPEPKAGKNWQLYRKD